VVRGNAAGFVVGVIGLGLCFGGVMGVMPALVSARFGLRYQGVNYGIAFSAYAVSAYFAPHLAATIGERSGDYTAAFLAAIAAAVVGLAVTVVLARHLHAPQQAPQATDEIPEAAGVRASPGEGTTRHREASTPGPAQWLSPGLPPRPEGRVPPHCQPRRPLCSIDRSHYGNSPRGSAA
jgi:MFS family permease